MSDYISDLEKQGYTSLRTTYYREQAAAYPSLSPTPNVDLSDAKSINEKDLMTDKEGETEEAAANKDETPGEDDQGQVKETPTDTPEVNIDITLDESVEEQQTLEDKIKDGMVPVAQELGPKTLLVRS